MKKQIKIIILSSLLLTAGFIRVHAQSVAIPEKGYHINKSFDVVPNNKTGNKKVVLLTIDDGPSKQTKTILETLAKHNVKVIFFINGIHNKDAKGMISAINKAGHLVGNHTWDHANLKKIKNDQVKKEIESTSDLIQKETGSLPRFFRAPYGVSSPYIREIAQKNNMIYMNWSGSAIDWEKKSKDKNIFTKNVINGLHPGEIILIHEHPWSADALDMMLTSVEQKGYTFISPAEITY